MTNILIADDEPVLRKYLARFLEGLGYEVRTATTGREAVQAMTERLPDLLVTDIHMPDMDGFEVLARLRTGGVAMPVIAMSGGGRIDKNVLLGSASLMGAVLTLQKPFELEDLRVLVERALAGAGDTAGPEEGAP